MLIMKRDTVLVLSAYNVQDQPVEYCISTMWIVQIKHDEQSSTVLLLVLFIFQSINKSCIFS
jgi:hypothetical protein